MLREARAFQMKFELWNFPDRVAWVPRAPLPTEEAEAERQEKERKSMIEMDKAFLRAVDADTTNAGNGWERLFVSNRVVLVGSPSQCIL